MRVVCIIDLNNCQEDYAKCLDFMKTIEQKQETVSVAEKADGLDIRIGFIYQDFSPRYLEEPMTVSEHGSIRKSSVQDCHKISGEDIQLIASEKYIRYHLRVHSDALESNDSLGGTVTNLHYLAMLIKDIAPYLEKKEKLDRQLSVFLAPVSGDSYPFEDDCGDVDYDTYHAASQYLRLLSKQYTGVIYGVKENAANQPLVTSLEFHRGILNKTFFPLLLIDENNYDSLFSPLTQEYLDILFMLKKRERLGKSADDDPYAAMTDYVAETGIKHIRAIVESSGFVWNNCRNQIRDFLRNCGEMDLMHFSLFSFLIPVIEESSELDFRPYENVWRISQELSLGVRQIIQNSIQHSEHKEGFLTFYLHHKEENEETNSFHQRIASRFPEIDFAADGRDEALELIISDLNEKEDMIGNFVNNLSFEVRQNEGQQKQRVGLEGHETLIRDNSRIAIRNFFSEFRDCDALDGWELFRQEDIMSDLRSLPWLRQIVVLL